MLEFVHVVCDKETNTEAWLLMTDSKDNAEGAAKHLNACRDVQLPALTVVTKDRTVFSFRNGWGLLRPPGCLLALRQQRTSVRISDQQHQVP